MRKLLLAATLLVAACQGSDKAESAPSAKSQKEEEKKLASMTLDEVDKAIAAGQLKAVDCNGDDTRKKMGVVPGAILISDDETFAASELPADKTAKLVFYCMNPG